MSVNVELAPRDIQPTETGGFAKPLGGAVEYSTQKTVAAIGDSLRVPNALARASFRTLTAFLPRQSYARRLVEAQEAVYDSVVKPSIAASDAAHEVTAKMEGRDPTAPRRSFIPPELDAHAALVTVKLQKATEHIAHGTAAAVGDLARRQQQMFKSAYDTAAMVTPAGSPANEALTLQRDFVNDVVLDHAVQIGDAAHTLMGGKEIGITPKEEVATYGMATLLHCESPIPKEERHPEPLLLVFARMNDKDIQDLADKKSYVQDMVNRGHDVYMLDWGALHKDVSGWQEEAKKGMGDDVMDTIPHMVEEMKIHSGAENFIAQGWCQGAVLVAMYAAVQPEIQPDAGLSKIVLLTPPLHYEDGMGVLADSARAAAKTGLLDAMVDANGGLMDGRIIDIGVKDRDREKLVYGPIRGALATSDNQRISDSRATMSSWLNKTTDIPGPWYKQFVHDIIEGDNLVQGEMEISNAKTGETKKVDLKKVKIPVLVVGAELDDVAVKAQWEHADRYFGGPVQVTEIKDAGHINLMIGGEKGRQTWNAIHKFAIEPTTIPTATESAHIPQQREATAVEKHVETGEVAEKVKTYEVTAESVEALVKLFGGDVNDPNDVECARRLLPLGFHSASLADFSDEHSLAIYAGHSGSLKHARNGAMTINEKVETKGNKVKVTYTHVQEGETVIGEGSDKLVMVPFHPEPIAPKKAQIPTQRKAEEPVAAEEPREVIQGHPFQVTLPDIDTYAEVSTDQNEVHINEKVAKETMFKGRIAHGMLIAGRTTFDMARVLGAMPEHVDYTFTAPVRPEDTVIPQVSPREDGSFDFVVTNQKGKPVIKGILRFEQKSSKT